MENQKKLDQCIPVSVKLIRQDSKVNEIRKRDKKRLLALIETGENSKKKFTPIVVSVELCDFKIHPEAIQDYVQKTNLKVNLYRFKGLIEL